ncbi:hypothetical protein [Rhizobium sp. SSA_523]|uniref:hypothetical protein n=1 Tax=Rhizobium sp. SSA_523 TaxID=2952477 RepID=UPI002090C84D|nr:hypothetical protein [Rhizobium sp. SSA_523]MCO5733821.1 hypothetical protein [Rhizobium sp. SSA_523]WKC24907.1 hypothetical protein QTJ18_12925 [Rhizobium sp. SSA_523]
MQAALVMMTILGCDDGGIDCHYVATINQRFPSIALCNAVSEKELASFANISYPTVIAVCQDPYAGAQAAEASAKKETPIDEAAAQRAEEKTLAERALSRVSTILPSRADLREVVAAPVHLVEDGYAWAIRKFR